MTAAHALALGSSNPLDTVEQIALGHDWRIDRSGDDEIQLIVDGSWTDLHICLNWRRDIEGLHIACTFDLKVPQGRREEVARLISLVNEQLYFGHFDLWRRDGVILFRNGLILAGGGVATGSQCERLIALALEACERYYPTFQFVIWAGQSAEESIRSSLLETQGEA